MAKTTLKVTTPVGEFTRATATAYTHAVVRKSPRAMGVFERAQAGGDVYKGGVQGRWIKDRGFAVTWHGSERAAKNAAAADYTWDGQTEVVGVFAI